MAIIEWKGRSGMGGQLDGDFRLTSGPGPDSKVYEDFLNALRNGNVIFFSYHFYYIFTHK
jgi:hypothetical protein